MKQYAGMSANVCKTIKAGEEDINEEGLYAEINIIVADTKYELSNARDLVRTRSVDEIELMMTKASLKELSLAILDLIERIDEAEEKDKEKEIAYAEWLQENNEEL